MNSNTNFIDFVSKTTDKLNSNKDIANEFRLNNLSKLKQIGLPTHRKGNEEWKYTNLNKFTSINYILPVVETENSNPKSQELSPKEFDVINIINGKLSKKNNINNSNINIKSSSINTLTTKELNKFNSLLSDTNEEMAILNSALCTDYIFINITGDSVKLLINFINYNNSENFILNNPKVFINIDSKSQLELIENHYGNKNSKYTSNNVLEIKINKQSDLKHYRLLEESENSIHTNTTRVYIDEKSKFKSFAFSKGAQLARYDLKVSMPHEHSEIELNGLYYTSGKEHLDNYINLDHIAPHCISRINYKGILDGESHAIFGGTVLVREGAIKTDSLQSDKNLVLSPKAEIDSKPSLFIYVDDILAGHGATAGNIDEKTVYYMRSRGLDLETASKMLISGFAMEIIDKVNINELNDYLVKNYINTLPSYKFDF
ncbi:MAG: Fe-S cluster assembly protein SufD [SAR202 cluster bacterium]|nr:Fe-S cluster assembly protein SufD [SAR202 cluster bacterium]